MLNESSLTSPEDRDLTNKWKPQQSYPPLTDIETENAVCQLSNTSFIEKFPRVDRTYADPPLVNQYIGLFSFVPAKGAKPNEHGVFGYGKMRGNYGTEIESNQRAEYLVRNVDSYHDIFHTFVGRPFPITLDTKYSAEINEIDIRKEMTDSISTDIKEKRIKEKQEIDEIKQREKRLLEESEKAKTGEIIVAEPIDEYITLSVKKAQLSWNYLEHERKMKEIKELIITTREKIETMNKSDNTLRERYYAQYMDARKKAGISETTKDSQDNFIKYMVEDANLGF